jgi:hypothetical protein
MSVMRPPGRDLIEQALSEVRRVKWTEGGLVLGPRPGRKSKGALSTMCLTHVCTLLHEREGARSTENIANELDCQWIWIPLAGGGLDELRALDSEALVRFGAALTGTVQPRVYLHCSAGIHRTGFFASILLRLQSLDVVAIVHALDELRPVTAQQVGRDRIDLAISIADALSNLAGPESV